jgi:hypothetical protein
MDANNIKTSIRAYKQRLLNTQLQKQGNAPPGVGQAPQQTVAPSKGIQMPGPQKGNKNAV